LFVFLANFAAMGIVVACAGPETTISGDTPPGPVNNAGPDAGVTVGPSPSTAPGTGSNVGFDDPYFRTNESTVLGLVRTSDLVFVGTVTSIGAAPVRWSGRYASYQTIGYSVDSVLKGNFADAQLSVQHPVVDGSRTADAVNIGLSSTLFGVGNRLIILASITGPSVFDVDENFGVLPFSDANQQAVRASL
jgi:hypothetical protein